MDFDLMDDLEARQRELDRERKEARQILIQELQNAVDRLNIQPDELKFNTNLSRRGKRAKKPVSAP